MVDVLGVVLLSGRVEDQVEGKTEDLDRKNERRHDQRDLGIERVVEERRTW